LAELPEGGPLEQFLPKPPEAAGGGLGQALRQRSEWSSTFVASLELARQGAVALQQDKRFTAIYVSPPTAPIGGS
jgi:chromatin segregation and condensation protein Rec8/ScpA/Scc1 (kleisin family)